MPTEPVCAAPLFERLHQKPMKPTLGIRIALTTFGLSLASQAAFVNGVINFTSGDNGGIILRDLNGNVTTNPALATGVQSWLVPEVDTRSGSFITVPEGQAVSFPQTWIFDPSTPTTPLWTIPGFGNFTFTLSSSAIVLRDSDFLIISGTGTLTNSNFDSTPASWYFTTQGPASDGKFSWSSTTTAIPEIGAPVLLSGALLWICFLRRRDLT